MDIVEQAEDLLRQLARRDLSCSEVRKQMPEELQLKSTDTWRIRVWGRAVTNAPSYHRLTSDLASQLIPHLEKLLNNGHAAAAIPAPIKFYEVYDTQTHRREYLALCEEETAKWKARKAAHDAEYQAKLTQFKEQLQKTEAERRKLRSSWVLRLWDKVFYRLPKPPPYTPFEKAPVFAPFKPLTIKKKQLMDAVVFGAKGKGIGKTIRVEHADNDCVRLHRIHNRYDFLKFFDRWTPTAYLQKTNEGLIAFRLGTHPGQTPRELFFKLEDPAGVMLFTERNWVRDVVSYLFIGIVLAGEGVLIYLLWTGLTKASEGSI